MSDDGNPDRIDNSQLFDSSEEVDMECDEQSTESSAKNAIQGTTDKMEDGFTIINKCGDCIDDHAKNALVLSSSNASLSSKKGKKAKGKGQAKRLKKKRVEFEEEISRLKENESQLENRNSQLAEEIQRSKTNNDRLAEENNSLRENNISLSAHVKQLETKVECIPIMQKENEDLKQQYSRAQAAQEKLQDEVKGWNNYVDQLEKKNKTLQTNLARKDEENKNHVASAKIAEKQFETARKNFEAEKSNHQKQLKTLQGEKCKSDNLATELQKIVEQKGREIWQYQQHIQQMKNSISSHINTINSLEKDKKDLTLRLSKLAGANLTYNNPNIADLSDENRPTKLAEDFSELYDNEWTDAFEAVDIENEREKTQFMLNILKNISRLCHDTSRNHMDAIKNSLSTLVIRDLWTKEEDEIPEEKINGASASTQGGKTNEVQHNLLGEPVLDDSHKLNEERNKPDTSEKDVFGLITSENQDSSEKNTGNCTKDGKADYQTECKGVSADSAGYRNTCDKTTGKCQHNSERDASHVLPDSDAGKSDPDLHEERSHTAGKEIKKPDKDDNRNKDNKKSGSFKRCSKNRESVYPITLLADFEKLASEQKKTIVEIRKYFEHHLSEQFYKVGSSIIEKEMGIDQHAQESIVKYIEKCMTICWSMCRHEPPVHIEFFEAEGELKYDTNMFKPYTKTGKHLDFVVWPALYLHEGGPMLSKGVAQGRK